MTPDKQLDALVSMFPDLIWRKGENKFLFRTGTCALCDPLHCREDTLSLIKLPGFFSNRKTFVQELVYVMDRDFGSGADISNSDTLNPTEITAWLMLDATAPQLLEAVLLAGGVWEDQPDPYAALKQAHKEGKVIEVKDSRSGDWCPAKENHCWTFPVESYRVKPPFKLPPPPPGMRWHREDGWTAEDLPHGYRPLTLGEEIQPSSECCHVAPNSYWGTCWGFHNKPAAPKTKHETKNETVELYHFRTTRQLTFTHCGQTWTYHRPGDPMPCDGESKIYCVGGHLVSEHPRPAAQWFWNEKGEQEIIGWRYADEPKPQVPLGPEDILPGCAIRAEKSEAWFTPTRVSAEGIHHANIGAGVQFTYFTSLHQARYEINRSLPLTGKWNPCTWEPCHKPA